MLPRIASEKRSTPNVSYGVTREEYEEITARSAIVDPASHSSGEEHFQAFVRNLPRLVDAQYAFVAEFISPETATRRTLPFSSPGRSEQARSCLPAPSTRPVAGTINS
jgi:hypothetical protein